MSDSQSSLGDIQISGSAIASIASHAVLSSYGVVGMAAKNVVDGIANALTRDPHKGIEVTISPENTVIIDVYVIMEYGTNLAQVARSLSNAVRYQVEQSTELTVEHVHVHVHGLRISNSD
jgi:uncharacterized alkaline shock family protein YloU